MTHIFDRLLLYLLGLFLIHSGSQTLPDMLYILTGIIIVGITCYLGNLRGSLAEKLGYLLLPFVTLCSPGFTPFVALFLYAGGYKYVTDKRYMTVLFICCVFPVMVSGILVPDATLLLWIGMLSMALMMAWKSHELVFCREAIRHIRDEAVEKNSILSEKNKYLAANQEKEIHIATLSERNRIAREIHDNVGHLLSRSILQLGAIMAIHKGEAVETQLLPLKETLDGAMNNIRESVHDLHKDSFDIKEAAENLLSDLTDCHTQLTCDISMNADKEVKYAFLTILKEAVTNIQKHSNATKVTVILNELEEYYQLLIEDNGTINGNINHTKAGIGLRNMEERIHALQGIITFSTRQGFRIFISIPKKKEASKN